MVPSLRPKQSKRFVESIVRSIELPIRRLTARNPRERVASGRVSTVPLAIECYEGSRVEEIGRFPIDFVGLEYV